VKTRLPLALAAALFSFFGGAQTPVPHAYEATLWVAHKDFLSDEGRAKTLLKSILKMPEPQVDVVAPGLESLSPLEDSFRRRLVSLKKKQRPVYIFYVSAHGQNGTVIGAQDKEPTLHRFYSCHEIGRRLAKTVEESSAYNVGLWILLDQCYAKTCAWEVARAFREAKAAQAKWTRFPRIVSASDYYETARAPGMMREFFNAAQGQNDDGVWTEKELGGKLAASTSSDKLFLYPDAFALAALEDPAAVRKGALEKVSGWSKKELSVAEIELVLEGIGELAALGPNTEAAAALRTVHDKAQSLGRPVFKDAALIALSFLDDAKSPWILEKVMTNAYAAMGVVARHPDLEKTLHPRLDETQRKLADFLEASYVRD
jgi:hypothetical protein